MISFESLEIVRRLERFLQRPVPVNPQPSEGKIAGYVVIDAQTGEMRVEHCKERNA